MRCGESARSSSTDRTRRGRSTMSDILKRLQPQTVLLRNGLTFEYVEQGPRGGETLLLLHGITDTWCSFAPVLPWLHGDYNVIALSMRGHGGSDKAGATYRIRDFADDVVALAEQLSLPKFTLVGHS